MFRDTIQVSRYARPPGQIDATDNDGRITFISFATEQMRCRGHQIGKGLLSDLQRATVQVYPTT